MKAKDYSKNIGISVDEWAEIMKTSTQNIHKLVKESDTDKGRFKFDNFLFSTIVRVNKINSYDELIKIFHSHQLQKELFNK